MSENTLVVVFAGANGSGKSTITREISLHEDFPKLYINADEIARSLPIEKYPTEPSRNKVAADIATASRNTALTEKTSFAFETVLSTPGNVALLYKAKAAGFTIEAHIVITKKADINVDRVKIRAEKGGHDVPEQSIRDRYQRSMKLQAIVIEISDKVFVYDNSQNHSKPKLSIVKRKDNSLVFTEGNWSKNHFLDLLKSRESSRTEIFQSNAGATDAVTHNSDEYHGPIVAETAYHVAQKTPSGVVIHDKLMTLDSKGRFLTDIKKQSVSRISRVSETVLVSSSNVKISYQYVGGKNILDVNELVSKQKNGPER